MKNFNKKEFKNFKILYFEKYQNSSLELINFKKINQYVYIFVKNSFGICKIRKDHLLNGVIPSSRTAINPLEYFKNQYFTKFPNSNLIICEIDSKKAIVETEFGICIVNKNYLLNKGEPKINLAKDPFEYFCNQFYKKYPNSKIKLLSLNKKIVTYELNGNIFKGNKINVLNKEPKKGNKNESFKKTCETFKEKCIKIHNNKYNYDLVEFKGSKDKIKIICPIHGIFEQTVYNHFRNGCKKCQYDYLSTINNENNYNVKIWKNKGEKSKKFDSFKVYIIECWNENERFYKIGRTFLKTKLRFTCKNKMPYNYKIIKEIKGNAIEIFNLEIKLKKEISMYKYKPSIDFNGKYECFKQSETIVNQWFKCWETYEELQD